MACPLATSPEFESRLQYLMEKSQLEAEVEEAQKNLDRLSEQQQEMHWKFRLTG